MRYEGHSVGWTEYALLALLAVLWGSSYALIKIAVAEVPPITLVAARAAIACGVVLIVLKLQRLTLPRDAQTLRQLVVLSFFNSIAAWTLLSWGQQHINSALATVINSTSPVFVFLLALAFAPNQTPSRFAAFGAFLGLTGVIVLVGPTALEGIKTDDFLGQLAALAGAVSYACAALYGRRLTHLPPVVTAFSTMFVASAILVPLASLVDQPWTLRPTVTALIAILLLGVFSTGLAVIIYFRLLKTLGAIGVASQSYLRSFFGVANGVAVLGETLTVQTSVGLAMAVGGVVLINLPRRSQHDHGRRNHSANQTSETR